MRIFRTSKLSLAGIPPKMFGNMQPFTQPLDTIRPGVIDSWDDHELSSFGVKVAPLVTALGNDSMLLVFGCSWHAQLTVSFKPANNHRVYGEQYCVTLLGCTLIISSSWH